LRIYSLKSKPVQNLLRAHVEPPHIDIGPVALKSVFQQRQLIAAMRRVEDDRSAAIV
jgi:hypothetical protein